MRPRVLYSSHTCHTDLTLIDDHHGKVAPGERVENMMPFLDFLLFQDEQLAETFILPVFNRIDFQSFQLNYFLFSAKRMRRDPPFCRPRKVDVISSLKLL